MWAEMLSTSVTKERQSRATAPDVMHVHSVDSFTRGILVHGIDVS